MSSAPRAGSIPAATICIATAFRTEVRTAPCPGRGAAPLQRCTAEHSSPDGANGSRECAPDDKLRAIRESPIRGPGFRCIRATSEYVIALILRLRRHFAGGIDAQPAGGGEALLRQESALVVHLLRAFGPG